MIPIVTLSEMRDADARAVAERGQDALVSAAGTQVALLAQRLLTHCYGARVAAIVGPGLNGSDGRVAAAWLRGRGALVDVVSFGVQPALLRGYDLVIDAAFGTGCSRPYEAPKIAPGTIVLAVDLPSGVDTDSGALLGEPMIAHATMALGALKPAHLNGPSADFVGELHFASLGISTPQANGLVDDSDLAGFIAYDDRDHKWDHAVQALVGSTLMPGAAELVTRGALAAGASMIRLVSRGDIAPLVRLPPDVVHVNDTAIDPRCRAVVAGPGLGAGAVSWLRDALSVATCPVVLDADALDRSFIDECAKRDATWVLTPHAGEFARLIGRPLGLDRFEEVRSLARETGCVVLLKGPTTVIAHPGGDIRVVTSGTASLATAGSGDVLSGLIASTIARGHDPFRAASLAAHLHGRAGSRLVAYASASDIADSASSFIHQLARGTR